MPRTIEQLMDHWARWRMRSRSQMGLGFGRSQTDRIVSGLKGTLCRTCRGAKFVLVETDGRRRYEECGTCRGHGHIFMRGRGVNPALIKSTSPDYKDPVAEKIDLIVCRLIKPQRRVIEEYYFGTGTAKIMARRLRLSIGVFSRHLSEAHTLIECHYYNRFPRVIHDEENTSRPLRA